MNKKIKIGIGIGLGVLGALFAPIIPKGTSVDGVKMFQLRSPITFLTNKVGFSILRQSTKIQSITAFYWGTKMIHKAESKPKMGFSKTKGLVTVYDGDALTSSDKPSSSYNQKAFISENVLDEHLISY